MRLLRALILPALLLSCLACEEARPPASPGKPEALAPPNRVERYREMKQVDGETSASAQAYKAKSAAARQAPSQQPPSRVERYRRMQQVDGKTAASAQAYKSPAPKAEPPSQATEAVPSQAEEAAPVVAPLPTAAPTTAQAPEPAPTPQERAEQLPELKAETFFFAEIKIGAQWKDIAEPLLQKPCLEETMGASLQLLGFTPRGCPSKPDLRGFPEETALLVVLEAADEQLAEPVVKNLVWCYGTWLAGRSNFPIPPGYKVDQLRALLGAETESMSLPGTEESLKVHVFKGDIHALVDNEIIEALIFGPMPREPDAELWAKVLSFYQTSSLKTRDLDKEIR